MLTEGTATRSATQLAEDSERIGTLASASAPPHGWNHLLASTRPPRQQHPRRHNAFCSPTSVLHPPSTARPRPHSSPAHRLHPAERPALPSPPSGPRLLWRPDAVQASPRAGTVEDSIQSIHPRPDARLLVATTTVRRTPSLMLSGDIKEKGRASPGRAGLHLGSRSAPSPRIEQHCRQQRGHFTSRSPTPPALRLRHRRQARLPLRPRSSPSASASHAPAPNLEAVQVMNYTSASAFASRIPTPEPCARVHGYTYGAQLIAYAHLSRAGRRFPYAGGLVKTDAAGVCHQRIDARTQSAASPAAPSEAEMKEAKIARRPVTYLAQVRDRRRHRRRHDQHLPLQPAAHLLRQAT